MSTAKVLHGDCLKVLQTLPAESCHSLVTDPPAGITFMGKDWDGARGGREQWIEWLAARLREAHRVLKPGAHGLVWALPRTSHWTATALEDAGFEIRDCIIHLFGNGFPKNLDVSKAIDKAAGVEREVVGKSRRHGGDIVGNGSSFEVSPVVPMITAPATELAKKWNGWGTSLKPASEHWWLVRKPFSKTVVSNVCRHDVGALNLATCAVKNGEQNRWPPNAVFSHASLIDSETGEIIGDACVDNCVEGCPVAALDMQSGQLVSGALNPYTERHVNVSSFGFQREKTYTAKANSGGASRFYPCFRYQTKAAASDHPIIDGKTHPTVKNLALMQWLVKLVTPPGGIVLDCFAGTGSTGSACLREFFDSILIDSDLESVEYMRARLDPSQLSLFNVVSFGQPNSEDLA